MTGAAAEFSHVGAPGCEVDVAGGSELDSPGLRTKLEEFASVGKVSSDDRVIFYHEVDRTARTAPCKQTSRARRERGG